MATKQKIQNDYINHVLTEGKKPVTVFAFAKKNKFQEDEFYKHFGSFDSVDCEIWADLFKETIKEVKSQEVWETYSAREKALSFFYSFFELLKSKRSYVNYSTENFKKGFQTPMQLKSSKNIFEEFSHDLIEQGLETGEIADRKFLTDKYKDSLWIQLMFVLKFWLKDYSANFEKTDEAIERGVNVTFDLLHTTPLDSILEYGKFLFQNAGFKTNF